VSYPYANSTGGLVAAIRQLRSAFPAQVNADTLRKWSIAPNNESYLLSVLRFLGVIDEEGKKQAQAAKVFLEHDDTSFATAFSQLLANAYKDLFEAFGEEAWQLDRDRLIGFFRAADATSATVGTRQALTFQALAQQAGHSQPSAPKAQRADQRLGRGGGIKSKSKAGSSGRSKTPSGPKTSPREEEPTTSSPRSSVEKPQLTIRIEVNLPVTEDQSVYDKIFTSIRAKLIDG